MNTAEAITELEKAGWPEVADDLREGQLVSTVLGRLKRLAWESGTDEFESDEFDEPMSIVANINE